MGPPVSPGPDRATLPTRLSGGGACPVTTAPILARPAALHETFSRARYFGSLDGLRALSVLAVIWLHTVGHDPDLPRFFSRGAEGVTLFFAISGFLIVTLLLREQDRDGAIDLKASYIRRSLRIFPLYFAVLGLYVILVLAMERDSHVGREFLRNFVFFATYTSNWFVLLEGRVIFYFAWSLAAEEQFYLLWPSVQRFMTRSRALILALLVIVVVVALQRAEPSSGSPSSLWYRIVTGIPLAICFGVVLAHLLHWRPSYEALRWVLGCQASSLVALGVFIYVLSTSASVAAVHLSAALLVGACVCREDHLLVRPSTPGSGVHGRHQLRHVSVAYAREECGGQGRRAFPDSKQQIPDLRFDCGGGHNSSGIQLPVLRVGLPAQEGALRITTLIVLPDRGARAPAPDREVAAINAAESKLHTDPDEVLALFAETLHPRRARCLQRAPLRLDGEHLRMLDASHLPLTVSSSTLHGKSGHLRLRGLPAVND